MGESFCFPFLGWILGGFSSCSSGWIGPDWTKRKGSAILERTRYGFG